MPATLDRPSFRNWADLLAILTGVVLVGMAMWPQSATATVDADRETRWTATLWLIEAAAGGLALAAVFIGQRWKNRGFARLLLVGAAVLLIGALLLFRDFSARALLTTVVPAMALMAASFAIGPMPREIQS